MKRIILATIAAAAIGQSANAGSVSDMPSKQFINADPARYAHGTLVKAGSDVLFLGGQVGLDEKGAMPAPFEAQLELIFDNTRDVLAEAGMEPGDLVEMTYYVVAGEGRMSEKYWLKIFEVRERILGKVDMTGALVYVPALYRPEALVEVSAVAARKPE